MIKKQKMGKIKHHIKDVDPRVLGVLIINSILTAKTVGHTNPSTTLIDYFHPSENNNSEQFLKDYIILINHRMTLDNFIKKWIPDYSIETLAKFINRDPLAKKIKSK